MINIESYWVPESTILKNPHSQLSFWQDMNENGWELLNSYGNMSDFSAYHWESVESSDTYLLHVQNTDFFDFFIIPDKLRFFVELWIRSNVPSKKDRRDCVNGKWQHQLEQGWFDNPHRCQGIPCKQCMEQYDKLPKDKIAGKLIL